MTKTWKKLLAVFLALTALSGCAARTPQQDSTPPKESQQAQNSQTPAPEESSGPYIDEAPMKGASEEEVEEEAAAMASEPPPAIPVQLTTTAPGILVQKNERATIDYSNTEDGYVMVTCSGAGKRLKVVVYGPSYSVNETKYTYNLTPDQWTTFPLSDGNGGYKVTVYENTTESKYATLLTTEFSVNMADEFSPFLRPNQYVNYEGQEKTIYKAAELTRGVEDPLEKVEKIYQFVVYNISYDHEKAATVQSGYLPVLDEALESGKGICFDYAALMAGMLRSQGVPCRLVVGYAGKAYHAWISVWTEATGWIDNAVFFDGTSWHRMDPTFISSSNNSEEIRKYVGDGSNYNAMYLY